MSEVYMDCRQRWEYALRTLYCGSYSRSVISTPHDANTQVLMLSVGSLAFLGDSCGECNDEVGEQRKLV